MPADYRSAEPQAIIYQEDTDSPLSSDAQVKNNMRYLYFKKIAVGGKCIIQSCKDLHLGRVVCHKMLRPEFADDPNEKQLFLREARVTATLQHPNTAPVYEVGSDARDHYYFTMKLVSGRTLREILDDLVVGDKEAEASWDLERLIDVVIQVGQVLNYAHVHGVVHCDVKPANIVVGSFGEVLLLDWGQADVQFRNPPEEVEVEDDPNMLRSKPSFDGTPMYMSPEQIAGESLDYRTDIYSLGAILFEVLTLQQMAWGDNLDEMLQNKINNPAPKPGLVAPERNIPTALETVYLRCVAADPNQRIRSVLKIIHELLYWLRVDARHRPV